MREIPSEVATLLKSRSMIGDNKPNCEVTVGGFTGGSYDWQSLGDTWLLPKSGIDELAGVTIEQKSNGKLIVCGIVDGVVYEGEVLNVDTILSANETVTNWASTGITTNIHGRCMLFWADNILWLSVLEVGSPTLNASYKLYQSPSGNGGDWFLFSTIYSHIGSGTDSRISSATAGSITVLKNGRYVLCGSRISNGTWHAPFPAIWTSEDKGLTWTQRFEGAYGPSNHAYFTATYAKQITEYNSMLYWCFSYDYGGGGIVIQKSVDNGLTWSNISNLYYEVAGVGGTIYTNLEGGLLMLSSTYKVDTPLVIRKFIEPDIGNTIITLASFVTSYGYRNNHFVALSNKILIISNSRVLGLDVINTSIPVKSISINRNKNMAGSLNLNIDNKNGEWSPDNTVNQNVLFPNTEVTVKQGYGAELVQTFSGMIDRIEMSTFPQSISLSVRDKLKLALDQTISPQVIKYTEQTVEDIFIDLAGKAGLTVGTVETTGLTIAEKTFSWETYADCFSWLADLVGFEFGCDEEGKVYFKKDAIPSATDWILTFTDGTAQAYFPIVENSEVLKSADGLTTYVKDTDYTIDYDTGELTSLTILDGETLMSYVFAVYSFKEGEDIISLGYTIDDNDIYSKVIVYGKDSNDEVISAYKDYVSKDYYNVLSQKIMKIDVSEATTTEQLQAIADRAEMLMRSRVRIVRFAAVAVPWLQVGNLIQVVESSTTISELYRVTDLSTNMDDGGYTMQITCYHHSA